jgi:RecA-family ATPase
MATAWTPWPDTSQFDALREALDSISAGDSASPSSIVASAYQWIDPTAIPPRQWLHAKHYIRKYLSATAAASGTGKSSIVLLDAISMASGRDLLTGKAIVHRRVWYWNLEDPVEELQRRVQAIARQYGLNADDIGDRLYLDSGRSQPFCIAREDRRTGIVVNKPLVESATRNIVQRGIDVLILDPFVSTHAVSENDNGAIDTVAKDLAGIADAANCAVKSCITFEKVTEARTPWTMLAEPAR